MGFSSLISRTQITSDSSPRTRGVDRFIIHHAATTSLSAILSLFQPGGREVSANYALGGGVLVGTVDESRRAWTSSSAEWDGRAVTIEVANSVAADPWPVGDADFTMLARLIADVATRHNFPINDDTILTHQELYRRFGASYPTACPGDLQRRKPELLALARSYQSGGTPAGTIQEDTLSAAEVKEIKEHARVLAAGVPGNGARLARYAKSDKTGSLFALYENGVGGKWRVHVPVIPELLEDAAVLPQATLWAYTEWPSDLVQHRPGMLTGYAISDKTGAAFALYVDDRGNRVRRLITTAPEHTSTVPQAELWSYAATNQT